MRRKDREITDMAKIKEIIGRCDCCRIGFNDNGTVYIVPVNFGFMENQGGFTFYFHGASKGRKAELAKDKPKVGFELDTNYQLIESEVACGYSARYQSVIGNGQLEIAEGAEEKKKGLNVIMEHVTGKNDWPFDDKAVNSVTVFKLTVTDLSCKEHL